MASADFLQFVVTTSFFFSSSARPPRVSVTTFTSYICCIYTLKFGQYWTLFCCVNSSVSSMPCIQFLFVRPRLCRRLPLDSTSRWMPLPLANSSYCQVCSGLSPPSCNTCRAHTKKTREQIGVSEKFSRFLYEIYLSNFATRNFARQGKASERNEAVVPYGNLSESKL